MSIIPLALPKTFRSRPVGLYRFFLILLLLGGICLLGLIGILLRLFINTSISIGTIALPILLGRILLIMILLLISGFLLRAYSLVRGSKIILTPEGVIYNAVSFKMYTPWENVAGFGGVNYGIPFRGLSLREPAVLDRKIREGIQQGIAVIEVTRLMIGKTRFKRDCPFTHLFPLDAALVGYNWQEGEFGSYLRQYAS